MGLLEVHEEAQQVKCQVIVVSFCSAFQKSFHVVPQASKAFESSLCTIPIHTSLPAALMQPLQALETPREPLLLLPHASKLSEEAWCFDTMCSERYEVTVDLACY